MKITLRHRILLTFVLFSSLLSIVIVSGVLYVIEDIEDEFIYKNMQGEHQYVLQQGNFQADTFQQISHDTQFIYVVNQSTKLPNALHNLSNGFHSWKKGEKSFYVLITPYQQGKTFFIKDATEFENREITIRWASLVVVLLSIVLGVWLGRLVSGRVMSPVTQLAEQVAKLTPDATEQTRIAVNYAHDEVGQLAEIFDLYLSQIQQYIQREQDFTADASHELRTPLAIIQSAAELMQASDSLDERGQKQLQRIIRATERMSHMLEILLLLARELPDQQQSKGDLNSVHEVVQEVMENHRFMLKTGVELLCEMQQDFSILASKNVLSIVLSNLIKNAIQHTEQGEVRIQILNRQILIQDTGQGIDPAELQHIFTRFYSGKGSRGSGIGLSLVKRICDRQGWQIQLQSQPGHGTQVVLMF